MTGLAEFLAPLFEAFWSAFFKAYRDSKLAQIEKVTPDDLSDVAKFKQIADRDGVPGPDDWLPGTESVARLHKTAPDK